MSNLIVPQLLFRGAERGYNVEADTITQTIDGRDLNVLWNEFAETVDLQNSQRQALIDFLTFPVTKPVEDVPTFGSTDFEEASEFGEPEGQRTAMSYRSFGYDFKWYDLATRYTWKFLADADSAQVEALHAQALEADNRLVFNKVMRALFNNTNRTYRGVNVHPLYNGDGTIPPSYKGNEFPGTYTHYLTSGAATVDAQDLEDLIDKLDELGYTASNGVQQIIIVNKTEGKVIRTFRANTAGATYDFIPAQGQPTSLLTPGTQLLGDRAPSSVGGLTIIGSYGTALIAEEEYIPSGYMLLVGSGGSASLNNPVGFREHVNPQLRGLRQIPGDRANYPLVDSYYSRGFGTGVRQRGGAAIMQITANSSYTPPTQYR